MGAEDPEDVLDVSASAEEEEVADLRELLRHGSRPEARVQAANTLGEVGQSASESIQTVIIEDLIAVVVEDQNDEIRAAAIDSLYYIDSKNVDKLVSELTNQFNNGPTPKELANHFELWLTSTESEFRIVGAAAMERFGDESILSELEAAFEDPDPRVRARATQAYSQFDGVSAEPIESLLSDERALVRRAAAQTLGNIGGSTALEVLVSAMGASDSRLRLVAARQLGQFDQQRSVRVLVSALTDHSSNVRYRSAVSLLTVLSVTDRLDIGKVPATIRDEIDASELGTVADTVFEIVTDANDQGIHRELQVYAVWLLGELSVGDDKLAQSLVPLLQHSEQTVVDLTAAYLKRLEGEQIERELQRLISDSTATAEIRDRARTILRRVKRNAAAGIVDQSVEYTYVQSPKDYTIKHQG
jgi:HEAT repeat protein